MSVDPSLRWRGPTRTRHAVGNFGSVPRGVGVPPLPMASEPLLIKIALFSELSKQPLPDALGRPGEIEAPQPSKDRQARVFGCADRGAAKPSFPGKTTDSASWKPGSDGWSS